MAVPALLSIFTVTYEIISAVLTSVRSVQALNVGGPWRTQQRSLTFLVLREGLHYHTLNFLRILTPLSLLFFLYGRLALFWVDFDPSASPG